MPKTTYHRTADGQQVDERDAFDHRGGLKDGFTSRTKLTLMDGVPVDDIAPLHRPGSIAMSDAEHDRRVAAIIAGNARLSDAWRNPPAISPEQVQDKRTAPAADPYERYDRRLQDAWRA
jgi:hypothetical protein